MLLYKYDERTREYLGYFEAYLDELETQIKGEPVYVIPPCSTPIKPTQPAEGFVATFNGKEWEEVEDNRGLTLYDKNGKEVVITELGPIPNDLSEERIIPLKELKDSKLEEITQEYQKALSTKIKIKGLEVLPEEMGEIKRTLESYNDEFDKIVYKDEIVEREDLEEVQKYLYIKKLVLVNRKKELVKELRKFKGKNTVNNFTIDFNVDKEVEELLPLSIEEINIKF